MAKKVVGRRTASRRAVVPFPLLCRTVGLPEPVAEHRFHPTRKWRIDWAWPEQLIGLEVDGAVWVNGRHTRGSGWIKDTEKLNTAAAMGYRMLRATPQQIASGDILPTLLAAFRGSDVQ